MNRCDIEDITIQYDEYFERYYLFVHYYENEYKYDNDIVSTFLIISNHDYDVVLKIQELVEEWLDDRKYQRIKKKDWDDYEPVDECRELYETVVDEIDPKNYFYDVLGYDFDEFYFDQCDDQDDEYDDEDYDDEIENEKDLKETYSKTKSNKKSSNSSPIDDGGDKIKPNTQSPSSNKNQEIIKKNKKGILLDDIAGLDEAKKAFKEKVILPITHAHIYKQFNKKTGGGILLYGLPGTGKTMFAEAVSNEIDAKFFSLKCSDIKSKWSGESEGRIKKLFNDARKEKRAIIFFDEFEAIGRKRSSNEDSYDAANDIVPEILAQMQGVGNDTSNILIIAATNRPWDIDSALLRPGRFDVKIHIPLPDFDARKKIFDIKLKETPNDNLDTNYLAEITDGCNGADVADFVERLKMEAIHRSIKENKPLPINNDDVKNVLKTFKSSVISDDINKLENFEFNK